MEGRHRRILPKVLPVVLQWKAGIAISFPKSCAPPIHVSLVKGHGAEILSQRIPSDVIMQTDVSSTQAQKQALKLAIPFI